MRIIKPGKLGVINSAKPKKEKSEALKPREVWDDFGQKKKKGRKIEYENLSGDRLVAKPQPRLVKDAPAAEALDENPFEQRDGCRTDYGFLEEKIGYSFNERQLLLRGLTHRSALGLKDRTDYERLEFLGDAVLDLTIAHLLCEKYPEAKEGELSKMRAALVNTQSLANFAKELEIGPFIKLGRGEHSSGGQERPSILADVMEAVVGAIYQDGGYPSSFQAVVKIFGEALEQVEPSDPKTELQEMLHASGSEPPTYLLEMVEGPEHAPTFVTVVMIDGMIGGRGRGATKKGAQQAAAAEALQKMMPSPMTVTLADGQKFLIPEVLLSQPIFQPAREARP